MSKKINFSTFVTAIFIAMTVTFTLTMIISTRMFEQTVAGVTEKESMYEKIADIDKVVRKNYYTELDTNSIYHNLATGYIAGLNDSESTYYTSEEIAIIQELSQGKMLDIGVDIVKSRESSGYMRVYKVKSGSPADIEGFLVDDMITTIDGVDMKNVTVEAAIAMLTGQSGKTVEIGYLREGAEKSATLVHKAYDTSSISYTLEDSTGYIKISTFATKTASELEYAVKNLTDLGATNLCIDIRGNSSKEFDSAALAADVLLKEGTTMQAIYNDGSKKVLYTSDKNSTELPIALITNSGTGYAAEMFACMLKDTADAKLVGTATMGKGTIQQLFRLPDGSGVNITVAQLSPMVSAPYNGIGLIPDYERALDAEQESTYFLLSISEDPQIQRAFEVSRNLVKS